MKQWDISEAWFPYTDFRDSKLRRVLIISPDNINNPDFVTIFITTKKQYNTPSDFRITKAHPEFNSSGLIADSTFRVGKIVTIDVSLIEKVLGSAGPMIQKEIKMRLKTVFGL